MSQQDLLLKEMCNRQATFRVTFFDHNKVEVKVSTADGREHEWAGYLDSFPEVRRFATVFAKRKARKMEARRFLDLLDSR